jgi:hypothetical protein
MRLPGFFCPAWKLKNDVVAMQHRRKKGCWKGNRFRTVAFKTIMQRDKSGPCRSRPRHETLLSGSLGFSVEKDPEQGKKR